MCMELPLDMTHIGLTRYSKCCLGFQDKDGKTCLHYAAYRGRKDVADAFLLVGGADLVKIQVRDVFFCLFV